MRIIPGTNTIRKGVLLYRGIRYRRGYGVHSPFVYNLITKVIEERCLYYSFYDIELIRKQLLFRDRLISYPDRQKKGRIRRRPIGEIVEREAIKPKHGALLFRLANYFKSQYFLQLGPAMGLSTLYLTSYASGLKCIALENVPELASIAKIAFEKAARNPIDLRTGVYKDLLPKALNDMERLDFVFFNTLYEQHNNHWLFEECLKRVHDDTIFVFEGIKASRKMRDFWQNVCSHSEVTVTIDLYSMGIVFFNKHLHKRNYIVYF
ncbi:SAM-dependent methyltransferase [Parabacteroides sp. AM08-6]|uniref:SAM-dependent methyltransferase n=1 Tax=Parabacteroides sp. AM08-6 TaxID=2292053 RepID=UPI000EFF4EA4|nr:SAM-dependent methyltransferase [Parabacteroides sp. AM08-6]RHJ82675.1 SAM-dependent methyltransferase [Parabacteroides sp. AM08-6]